MKCPKCGTISKSTVCPKCGFSYQNNDIYSNNINLNDNTFSQNRNVRKTPIVATILSVFGFICFIIMLFNLLPEMNDNGDDEKSDVKAEETIDSSLITLYEFEKIRVGMSKNEVYDIVGSFGELTVESGSLATDDYCQIYSYEGYGDLGANAVLTFYNLKLESKAQSGLKGGYSESTKPKESSEKIEDVKIDISEIELEYEIVNDSVLSSAKRIEAKYKNNTKYTITALHITAAKKSGEDIFLMSSDTVKPGEISPIFDAIEFNSIQKSDISLTECTIRIQDESGATTYVAYDYSRENV